MFGIRKFTHRESCFRAWKESWIHLADDLVGILSFGYLTTDWPDMWKVYPLEEE